LADNPEVPTYPEIPYLNKFQLWGKAAKAAGKGRPGTIYGLGR
jgi:hypothetical protein